MSMIRKDTAQQNKIILLKNRDWIKDWLRFETQRTFLFDWDLRRFETQRTFETCDRVVLCFLLQAMEWTLGARNNKWTYLTNKSMLKACDTHNAHNTHAQSLFWAITLIGGANSPEPAEPKIELVAKYQNNHLLSLVCEFRAKTTIYTPIYYCTLWFTHSGFCFLEWFWGWNFGFYMSAAVFLW